MICITDETRLTGAEKAVQLMDFIDHLFEKIYKSNDYDHNHFKFMEEEYERIKSG